MERGVRPMGDWSIISVLEIRSAPSRTDLGRRACYAAAAHCFSLARRTAFDRRPAGDRRARSAVTERRLSFALAARASTLSRRAPQVPTKTTNSQSQISYLDETQPPAQSDTADEQIDIL